MKSQLLSPKIVRSGERPLLERAGEARYQLLDINDTGGACSLIQSKFQLGAGSRFDTTTSFDRWLFVLRGEFCFQTGNKAQLLSQGHCVFAPRGMTFDLTCEGEPESEILLGTTRSPATPAQTALKIVGANEGECREAFGSHWRMLVSSGESGGQFSLAECETPSFGGPPPHLHGSKDQIFFIRSGCFELQLEDARVHAQPGDCVFAPRGIPHTFRVVSGEPGRALLFSIPGASDPFFH